MSLYPLTAVNVDFWVAVSTIGPVTFLAIGAADSSKRTAVRVQLVALNVAFFGTLVPTTTAILSLAWRQNLLPPKVNAVVIVLAILAFWVALAAHFYDLENTPRAAANPA